MRFSPDESSVDQFDFLQILETFQTQSHQLARLKRTDDPGGWGVQVPEKRIET